MEQIDYKFIDQVLADHACDASQIIAIMQDVQAKYRYLPKDALRYIADKGGHQRVEDLRRGDVL